MFIYDSQNMIPKRIKIAEELLNQIPAKHCFITGSFLYKEKFKDIDIFIISRSKKKFTLNYKKVKITIQKPKRTENTTRRRGLGPSNY